MMKDMHLTNTLQAELIKIGSPLTLQKTLNSDIKINAKDWAYALAEVRSLQALTYVGLDRKHLQIEEKE